MSSAYKSTCWDFKISVKDYKDYRPIKVTLKIYTKTKLRLLLDKEDVVHTYNGLSLSNKKEENWVICRDLGGPRICHTAWSKSEREKYHILMHTCGI